MPLELVMADATSKWHGRLQEGLLKISRRANSNEAMAKTSTRFDATSTVAFTLQVARMSSAMRRINIILLPRVMSFMCEMTWMCLFCGHFGIITGRGM